MISAHMPSISYYLLPHQYKYMITSRSLTRNWKLQFQLYTYKMILPLYVFCIYTTCKPNDVRALSDRIKDSKNNAARHGGRSAWNPNYSVQIHQKRKATLVYWIHALSNWNNKFSLVCVWMEVGDLLGHWMVTCSNDNINNKVHTWNNNSLAIPLYLEGVTTVLPTSIAHHLVLHKWSNNWSSSTFAISLLMVLLIITIFLELQEKICKTNNWIFHSQRTNQQCSHKHSMHTPAKSLYDQIQQLLSPSTGQTELNSKPESENTNYTLLYHNITSIPLVLTLWTLWP